MIDPSIIINKEIKKEEEYNLWHSELAKSEIKNATLSDPWYVTVQKLLPTEFSGKILEIGCGRGDFSILLAEKYPKAQIVGTDFSYAAVVEANRKKPHILDNLTFSKENAEKLTYNDEEFDLIISCETMEHVFHPLLMAKEIYRTLKKDGHFILTTENYFNGMLLAWLQTWILNRPFNSGCGVQPHENFMLFFNPLRHFKKAGFKKIHTLSNHYQWLLYLSCHLTGFAQVLSSVLFYKEFSNHLEDIILSLALNNG